VGEARGLSTSSVSHEAEGPRTGPSIGSPPDLLSCSPLLGRALTTHQPVTSWLCGTVNVVAELLAVGMSLTMLGAAVGVVVGLLVWANAVARKHPGRLYRPARWLPRIGAVLLGMSGIGTTVALVGAFGEVAETDAASRATMLARRISTAMNYGALPATTAVFLLFVSALVSLSGTLSAPSSARDSRR